jgi:microcystin-dependent protein
VATGLHLWSRTAATNATADSSINWAEGQAPSSVNDSARAMMARIAEWRDDLGGITTGGTSTAYTLTSNRVFASAAAMDKAIIGFIPHASNGDNPTLAVDGLIARQIRTATGLNVPAASLIAGTVYQVIYIHSSTEFILINGNAQFMVPLGAMLPFTGGSAPNSNFVLPAGQAISRTTYATYFAMVNTTYGVGDGSTTFNVPDMRGRVPAGFDSINGSAANRLTTDANGFGTPGNLGSVGGAEKVTLVVAHLPAHDHGGATGNDSADHTHTGGDLFDAATANSTSVRNDLANVSVVASSGFFINNSGAGNTGGVNNNHTHPISSQGSSIGHANVQPTICVNYILRVL